MNTLFVQKIVPTTARLILLYKIIHVVFRCVLDIPMNSLGSFRMAVALAICKQKEHIVNDLLRLFFLS